MKTKKIILFGFILVLITSCKDYLEPWPNGNYDSETIWQYQDQIQGLITRCYDNIDAYSTGNSNRNYNDNEGAFLDGLTDNAVITSSTHVLRRYAVNSMTTSQDPFATFWDRDYRSIAQCNMFLQDRRGYNTRFMVNAHYNDLVKNRLQGEAFALRAFFEWDLLQKFGGKGPGGEMLGFPIITKVLNVNDEINYARNTYDECVTQIIADCDSAIKYLPLAWRDFLFPSGDNLYAGGKYFNRFDDLATIAIKANVYLTWASPRFNPDNVAERWDSAARYAKYLIDWKLIVDNIASNNNSFRPTDPVIWTNPNSPEIVFSTRYNTSNNYMEKMFYPGGFQGNGELGATQELVNSFPMANGYPIDDPTNRGAYDAANPFAGRDQRFYSTIYYNAAIAWKDNDASKPANKMYTFENWNEGITSPGKDAAGTSSKNSRTNYHIKKFVYMGWNPPKDGKDVKTITHSKFIYRWAHFVLAYAEAANHVTQDPNTAPAGSKYIFQWPASYDATPVVYPPSSPLTPKAALKLLRARKTYDGKTNTFNVADPYLDEAAGSEATFDALVKRERRIETCFEGMRYYDLQRWTTDADWESVVKQPVHGAYIVQTALDAYTYNLNWEVEPRNPPSPYNPIPYNEMLRMSNLVQNEGWPSWN